jgi:hypothetical protein
MITALRSSVRVKDPDLLTAFLRESISRVAIRGMKIALELGFVSSEGGMEAE